MVEQRKNQDIEALRGIAILLVMIGHFILIFKFRNAEWGRLSEIAWWTGVDLFFAISGFVITKSLFHPSSGVAIDGRHFRAFWLRRFFRLMPSAWLWLVILLCLGPNLAFTPDNRLDTLLKASGAAAFAGANFYWAYCFDLAATDGWRTSAAFCGNPDLGSNYWSLSLEEQFYLLLSLAALFAGLKRIAAFAVLLLAIQLFLPRPEAGVGWFVRTDALCWGILIYFATSMTWYEKMGDLVRRYTPYAACVILSALGFLLAVPQAIFANASDTLSGAPLAVVGLCSGFLVWLASYDARIFGKNFMSRFFVWVGERSYALYLCHTLLFHIIYDLMMLANVTQNGRLSITAMSLTFIACSTLCLVCADLNYRHIERPLTKKGRDIAAKYLGK